MRDEEARRHEGEHFAIEKALAAVYLVAFVVVVGLGAYTQLGRIMPAEGNLHAKMIEDSRR